MKKSNSAFSIILLTMVMVLALAPTLAFAEGGDAGSSLAIYKTIASGAAIAIAAFGAVFAMSKASVAASEAIAKQPEAEAKIRTAFMLGLVFIETAIIYVLLVVILIIFVI